MAVWWSLTKKELRLGQSAFLLVLITFTIVTGIASYFGYREGLFWEVVLVMSTMAVAVHVLYLTFYLLYSLQAERSKLHLWLHNPLPGYALLLAKITAGLFSMAVSLLIIGSILLIALNMTQLDAQLPWSLMTDIGLFAGIHIVLFAISLAVWFTFLWMIFLLFNRSLSTFISFILTFFTFLVLASVYGWFTESVLYETLTSWGEVQFSNVGQGIYFSLDSAETEFTAEIGDLTLYAGNYVFEAIVTVALFLVASWMLDRKVEV